MYNYFKMKNKKKLIKRVIKTQIMNNDNIVFDANEKTTLDI